MDRFGSRTTQRAPAGDVTRIPVEAIEIPCQGTEARSRMTGNPLISRSFWGLSKKCHFFETVPPCCGEAKLSDLSRTSTRPSLSALARILGKRRSRTGTLTQAASPEDRREDRQTNDARSKWIPRSGRESIHRMERPSMPSQTQADLAPVDGWKRGKACLIWQSFTTMLDRQRDPPHYDRTV